MSKHPLVRFGVSIPETLCRQFDTHIKNKQYTNRSEAIRDLIRKELIQNEIIHDKEVVGVLNILYNHHYQELNEKLTHVQHQYSEIVLSSMHIHLDHNNCIEVILMKGNSQKIRRIAEKLIAIKGVKHGNLNLTSTGKSLE
jgi:CopG family nickel-responsive transcriptional regulator